MYRHKRNPQGGVYATWNGRRVRVESWNSEKQTALIRYPSIGNFRWSNPKRVPLAEVDFGYIHQEV